MEFGPHVLQKIFGIELLNSPQLQSIPQLSDDSPISRQEIYDTVIIMTRK